MLHLLYGSEIICVQDSSEGSAWAEEGAAGAASGPAMRLSLRTPLSDGRGAVTAQLLVNGGPFDGGSGGRSVPPILQKVCRPIRELLFGAPLRSRCAPVTIPPLPCDLEV